MKKIILLLASSALLFLVTACGSGCGCPGGAGYKTKRAELQQLPVEKTFSNKQTLA
ncbi:MAG: hypothetical protein LBR81_06610 [Prevotellaceae bacterium]|jgi:hypothetical protein|nr:hypothetical protein [Prevotellaceae bacterium]